MSSSQNLRHPRVATFFAKVTSTPSFVRFRLLISLFGALFGLMSLSLPAAALPALTSVSVNASVTTAPYGSPITLTASVTSGGGTPYGTVIFLSDLVSLGSVMLDGSGQATLTTSALAVGLHAVVAVYLGNLDFLTSTAVALNVNISLAVCTINVVASTQHGAARCDGQFDRHRSRAAAERRPA